MRKTETPAMDKLMRLARDDPRRMRWVWFVEYYLQHHEPPRAVRDAGFSGKNARHQAQKLMRHPAVRDAIEEGDRLLLEQAEIKAEDVVNEYALIARRDIGDIYDDDGKLKNIKDMPEHVRRIIKSIQYKDGKPVKIIFESKTDALNGLGRYFKLFTENVEVTGSVELTERIMKGRERARKRSESA